MQGLKSLCYNMNYSLTPHIIFESFFRVVRMALSANLIALLEAILLFGKYQIESIQQQRKCIRVFFSLFTSKGEAKGLSKNNHTILTVKGVRIWLLSAGHISLCAKCCLAHNKISSNVRSILTWGVSNDLRLRGRHHKNASFVFVSR